MPIKELNEQNFETLIAQNGIVMIDCWAEWCSACSSFNIIYEKIAVKHPVHTFAKLNTAKEKQLVARLGIEHVPALMLYRDGILLFQQPGYYEEEKLEDIIRQAENINMDEVKSHIESKKIKNEKTN